MPETTTIGSREARQKWRDVLDTVYTGAADMIIERHGKAVAALIPYEDYLALQDALEDLRAARRAAEIQQAEQRGQAHGRFYSEIRTDLENKGLLDE
jgi:prevent-host-death family protein